MHSLATSSHFLLTLSLWAITVPILKMGTWRLRWGWGICPVSHSRLAVEPGQELDVPALQGLRSVPYSPSLRCLRVTCRYTSSHSFSLLYSPIISLQTLQHFFRLFQKYLQQSYISITLTLTRLRAVHIQRNLGDQTALANLNIWVFCSINLSSEVFSFS